MKNKAKSIMAWLLTAYVNDILYGGWGYRHLSWGLLSRSIVEGLFSTVEGLILNGGRAILHTGTANRKNPRWIKVKSQLLKTLSIIFRIILLEEDWEIVTRASLRSSCVLFETLSP